MRHAAKARFRRRGAGDGFTIPEIMIAVSISIVIAATIAGVAISTLNFTTKNANTAATNAVNQKIVTGFRDNVRDAERFVDSATDNSLTFDVQKNGRCERHRYVIEPSTEHPGNEALRHLIRIRTKNENNTCANLNATSEPAFSPLPNSPQTSGERLAVDSYFTPQEYSVAGDVITFYVRVYNEGTLNLTSAYLGANPWQNPAGFAFGGGCNTTTNRLPVLYPLGSALGPSSFTCTATYTVTAADVTTGFIGIQFVGNGQGTTFSQNQTLSEMVPVATDPYDYNEIESDNLHPATKFVYYGPTGAALTTPIGQTMCPAGTNRLPQTDRVRFSSVTLVLAPVIPEAGAAGNALTESDIIQATPRNYVGGLECAS